jgi:hypothetical protein
MNILSKIEDYCIKHKINLLYGTYLSEANCILIDKRKTTIEQFLHLNVLLNQNQLIINVQEFLEEEAEIEGFERYYGHVSFVELIYIKDGFAYKYNYSEAWFDEYMDLLTEDFDDEVFNEDYLD